MEKLNVIPVLYNYINRHAGTPNKTMTKHTIAWITAQFVRLGLGSDGCRRKKSTSYRSEVRPTLTNQKKSDTKTFFSDKKISDENTNATSFMGQKKHDRKI